MYIHIHAVKAGYQCGYHQCDGEARHAFHDGVHVIGYDGGEGVHRSRKDVTVNVHRVVRLFQLYHDVLQQFQVEIVGILEDILQPSYHNFVSSDGSVEVYERLLQLHQLKKVFVTDTLFQFLFGGGYIVINLLQVFQEPYGRGVYDSQNQRQLIVDDDTFAAGMLYEVRYQFGVMIAHGNDDVVVCDNTDGHSDKRDAVLAALHGNTQDSQQPVAFRLRTRALIRIGYIFKE